MSGPEEEAPGVGALEAPEADQHTPTLADPADSGKASAPDCDCGVTFDEVVLVDDPIERKELLPDLRVSVRDVPGLRDSTEVRFPLHGGAAGYCAHIVIWADGGCDRARTYAVLRALWRRRLLPINASLIAALPNDGLAIAIDAGEEQRAVYRADVRRLSWALPLEVDVVPLEGEQLEFAERAGCGVRYADEIGGDA